MNEGELLLRDGRTAAYAEFGDPAGRPVLYCHGSPSSRLEPLFVGEETIARAGLRLVAPDRPGIGRSSPLRRVTFGGWTADAIQIVDHLGWDRFAVLGNSGGTGFAVACAALLLERVTRLALVSGAWRMDSPEAREGLQGMYATVQLLAKRAPWLLRLMFTMMGAGKPGDDDQKMAEFLAPPDAACMRSGDRAESGRRIMAEALRQEPRAAVDEMRLYLRDWDFELSRIRVPVVMHHGREDRNAPVAMARALAAAIPGAQLTEYPDEAHLSTLCNRFESVAGWL